VAVKFYAPDPRSTLEKAVWAEGSVGEGRAVRVQEALEQFADILERVPTVAFSSLQG
jgi:hypothetical protein